MDHFIEHLEIHNFKSIRELKLTGFKRINLFIGRPNVGKSNLLEALSLFGLSYIWKGTKNINDIIRVQNLREIFYDGLIRAGIGVKVVRRKDHEDYENFMINFIHETNSLSFAGKILIVKHMDNKATRYTTSNMYAVIDPKLKIKSFSSYGRTSSLLPDIKLYTYNRDGLCCITMLSRV